MCFRELPGPIEGVPIYPQGYIPFREIVYEVSEIAVMQNDDTSLWVVGVETIEF